MGLSPPGKDIRVGYIADLVAGNSWKMGMLTPGMLTPGGAGDVFGADGAGAGSRG